jgi:hypothetical protein
MAATVPGNLLNRALIKAIGKITGTNIHRTPFKMEMAEDYEILRSQLSSAHELLEKWKAETGEFVKKQQG